MDLQKMSIEELLNLRAEIADIIEAKMGKQAAVTRASFRVGDRVKVNHPRVVGKFFTVVKINRTTFKLKDEDGRFYRVDNSFIQQP